MAWLSYLVLYLNKTLQLSTLCLLYQTWGAKTTCREWKGGDGKKKFEKHWSNRYFRLKVKSVNRVTQEALFCATHISV